MSFKVKLKNFDIWDTQYIKMSFKVKLKIFDIGDTQYYLL
jgi:hypothetical protein